MQMWMLPKIETDAHADADGNADADANVDVDVDVDAGVLNLIHTPGKQF